MKQAIKNAKILVVDDQIANVEMTLPIWKLKDIPISLLQPTRAK